MQGAGPGPRRTRLNQKLSFHDLRYDLSLRRFRRRWATFMQDFSIYHLLATAACIALFIWLRIRLFGRLNNPEAESGVIHHPQPPSSRTAHPEAGSAEPRASTDESSVQQA